MSRAHIDRQAKLASGSSIRRWIQLTDAGQHTGKAETKDIET